MMKTCCIVLALLISATGKSFGQTITTDPKDDYCSGWPVTVPFAATGNFAPDNVFSLQLSSANGSFGSYTIVGSLKSTTSGVITGRLPQTFGSNYRMRVVASNPYFVGRDNGVDIAITYAPNPQVSATVPLAALTGQKVRFWASGSQQGASYLWSFGDGSSPTTSTDSAVDVVYNSSGVKFVKIKVLIPSGCLPGEYDTSTHYTIYSCDTAIPDDAAIDSLASSTLDEFPNGGPIWVLSGSDLDLGNEDVKPRTIFAEAGSIVRRGRNKVIYLKPGASFDGALYGGHPDDSYNTIIASPGASANITEYSKILRCDSVRFDYSHAPARTQASVETQRPPRSHIYPNPAADNLTIESLGQFTFSICNSLGVELQASRSSRDYTTINLSRYLPGAYYLQLVTENGREVRKFTVAP